MHLDGSERFYKFTVHACVESPFCNADSSVFTFVVCRLGLCTRTHTHTHMHACTHACTHTHTHARTHTHTHTHTHLHGDSCINTQCDDETCRALSHRHLPCCSNILSKVAVLLKFPKSPKVDKILPPLHVTSKMHRTEKLRKELTASVRSSSEGKKTKGKNSNTFPAVSVN